MKLLVLAPCPFPAPRGSQVFIAGTARGLQQAGHQVTIACYAHSEGPDPAGIDIVRAGPVPFARGGSGPHPSKALANLRLAATVRQWCRDHRPDAVLAHNVEAPLVARAAGVTAPVIWEAHTRMDQELPTFLPGTARLGSAVDRLAARASDSAVALSDPGADWLRRMGLRAIVIPPGVDPSELDGANRDRGRARYALDERPWVVYAGNGDAYQDLPLLVRAVAELPDVGLLIVAPGATGLDPLGISSERLRRVDAGDLASHLDAVAAGDIAALPRGDCAGFPMKLLNQAALGRPTVAVGESARPVPGTVAVPAGSASALADALGRLARDESLRTELGREARRGVAAFSWKRRGEQLGRWIRDVS